jgi:hypothetical protein
MKKLCIILLLLTASTVFGQQKFALVIGNGAYVHTTRLNNPVNDANDMTTTLQGLGFTVDKLLNGTQDQMVNAIIRLKNRLSASKNSYGFIFYAGHGIQANGENYLIPVDANIPTENFLRNRTVSVQEMLDELNDAGNELNVVILDACRDNPFSWRRSGTRGLTIVGQQPADSIIVYATSAGSTAADGTGRNGLFTTHLLNNLKTSGLDINEVFRRTGSDVASASNNQQRPAVYNQFFGIAYLGQRPTTPIQPIPTPTVHVYRVGDTGPAGGIIFHDKGSYSDGWRYLEASPSVTDRVDQNVFPATTLYREISNRSVGAGLNNTRMYIERLYRNNVVANTALHYSNNLIHNGFNDWFLPSIEELRLMYNNLRNNSNAGFLPRKYWSSTCNSNDGAALFIDFSNGQETTGDWSGTMRIRAIRRF